MILPSKNVAPDQALITIGAQVLLNLEQPGTVSAVLERVSSWRKDRKMPSALPFWWFALALDFLFATGSIKLESGELVRLTNAP